MILTQAGKTTASPAPLLDDQVSTLKAIDEARGYGLSGDPVAQKAIHMDLAEWAELTDSALGKDAAQYGLAPDVPVFVLAIQGNVAWQGPGLLIFNYTRIPRRSIGQGEIAEDKPHLPCKSR